ncbi:MAG TPA: DegT/DnrJ/EryC1/StrS family aminotransferase [Syntrophorhabdaceae bacterium]|jgi:dTDP-4-amino-4,6-dideoxygalactose transaminase
MKCAANKKNNKTSTKLALYGGTPARRKGKFLVFGAPLIEKSEINRVVACLKSRWIGTGPLAHQFEEDFAAYKGKRFAVAVNSCTAALHLSLLASGVGPGDEVITTTMTFCATVNAIIHSGATPVLVDCDLPSMNISPSLIEEKITAKTKAILVVHFAGRCCDMDPIRRIAKRYNLMIIEDCAHAIESEYRGEKSGSFGDIGCFSFYVTKNIITGEGGMIVTDDERIASTVKVLGLHGMSKDAWKRFSDEGYKHYDVVFAGFKYNMPDITAAIGVEQLKRIEPYWEKRRDIWDTYNRSFADLACTVPAPVEEETRHAYHLYTPLIDIDRLGRSRDWVLNALTAENIGTGVHYIPIHRHPYYRKTYGWKEGEFPNAERIGDRTISLPLSPALSPTDVEDVIRAFRKVMSEAN